MKYEQQNDEPNGPIENDRIRAVATGERESGTKGITDILGYSFQALRTMPLEGISLSNGRFLTIYGDHERPSLNPTILVTMEKGESEGTEYCHA